MFRSRGRHRSLLIALYLNAGLLAVLLAVALGGRIGVGTPAFAAQPPPMPPIAGGGGVYVMPAQFALNVWGCYLLDTDNQTLCVYSYDPAARKLQMMAAREFRADRQLKNWNTFPNPAEVQRLVDLQRNPIRGKEPLPEDVLPTPGQPLRPETGPTVVPDGPPSPPAPGEPGSVRPISGTP